MSFDAMAELARVLKTKELGSGPAANLANFANPLALPIEQELAGLAKLAEAGPQDSAAAGADLTITPHHPLVLGKTKNPQDSVVSYRLLEILAERVGREACDGRRCLWLARQKEVET